MATEVTPSLIWQHLNQSLDLAFRGRGNASPNPMVGCVIGCGARVVSEGWHAGYGKEHAEAAAIRSMPHDADPSDVTLYVTLEPCNHHGKQPPCTDAIIAKGITQVVIGMADPNPGVHGGGIQHLEQNGVHTIMAPPEIAEKCRWLNRAWITAVTQHRPYVIVKIAQSADGFMAPIDKRTLPLTGEQTRQRVHLLRSEVDAVLVGMGTVRSDNPLLTVRDVQGRNPARIVIGDRDRLPMESNLAKSLGGYATFFIEHNEDLRTGIQRLFVNHSIQSILCEAGPTVTEALLREDLVDELRIHTSPVKLGNGIGWGTVPNDWVHVNTEVSGLDLLDIYVRRLP